MRFRLFFAVTTALILTGCVHHLSQQECMATDWQQQGFNDGAAGHQPRNLQGDTQDCAKFKITVDKKGYHKGYISGLKKYCSPTYGQGVLSGQRGEPLEIMQSRSGICVQHGVTLKLAAFKRGRAKGLRSFCTYQNGKTLGLQGKTMPTVCPASLQKRFARGWHAGDSNFCSNTQNALALGKAGSPYPSTCPANLYLSFNAEYNRGLAVRHRINYLKSQIAGINNQIDGYTLRFGLYSTGDGYYTLGTNRSSAAQSALFKVRELHRRLDRLKNQLFRAQSTG